jgi:hypothetical protein
VTPSGKTLHKNRAGEVAQGEAMNVPVPQQNKTKQNKTKNLCLY